MVIVQWPPVSYWFPAVIAGGYVLDKTKLPNIVVPDLTGFKVVGSSCNITHASNSPRKWTNHLFSSTCAAQALRGVYTAQKVICINRAA